MPFVSSALFSAITSLNIAFNPFCALGHYVFIAYSPLLEALRPQVSPNSQKRPCSSATYILLRRDTQHTEKQTPRHLEVTSYKSKQRRGQRGQRLSRDVKRRLRETVAVRRGEHTEAGGSAFSWTCRERPPGRGGHSVTVRLGGGSLACSQKFNQASTGKCLHFFSPSKNSKLRSPHTEGTARSAEAR